MLKKADEYDLLAACNSAWEAELIRCERYAASRRRRKALRNVTLKRICADLCLAAISNSERNHHLYEVFIPPHR